MSASVTNMSPRFALGIKTFCSLTKACVFLATVTRRRHCNTQTLQVKGLSSNSLKKHYNPMMEPPWVASHVTKTLRCIPNPVDQASLLYLENLTLSFILFLFIDFFYSYIYTSVTLEPWMWGNAHVEGEKCFCY